MKSAKEMYNYSKENDFGNGFSKKWSLKHFKIIENALFDDEDVIISFIGLHNYKSMSNHDKNYAYALSKKRILMAQKKLIGKNLNTVSLDYINDIGYNGKIARGVLTIDTMKEVFNVSLNKKSANKLSNKLQEILYSFNNTNNLNNKNTVNKSVASELKDLKELLDSGVLTQEEFDNQKNKLLNQS